MSKGVFYPLSIVRGETLEFEFDVQLMGENVDPSDVTITGSFTRPENVNPLKFTITESETNPYSWIVTYSAEDSIILTPDTYTWQINMTNNETGKVITLFYGTLEVDVNVILNPNPTQNTGGWTSA